MSVTPTVAIVGRPNVGKSTLFNRLLGRRKAIVHDQPGVTRDRVTGLATIGDNRAAVLVDTGGLVPGDDPLGLNQQVLLAVEESDLLIFMVDGKQGLLPADRQVWEELRRYGKPAVLAVNKSDTHAAQDSFSEFYGLGIDPQILISAEHGRGISGLAEALEELLPEREEEAAPDAPRLAIVGRPNVGKSSLLNRLVGEPRALVSPVAGTTRDPVDSLLEQENGTYLLIDTAGIRRRSRVEAAPEELAIMMARRQVERADLALLVIDAEAGVTTGDLAIAGTVWELGRAAVVVVNKWDLIDPAKREKLEESWPRLDEVLNRPRRVNVSALSARGVGKIFPAVEETLESFNTQLSTSEINRLFEEAVRRHHAPSVRGKPWKLYYATQVRTGPPTFMLFANHPLSRGSSYRRYLENRVTRELDLQGVPVRLVVRQKRDRE
jgi:GTP-binding protein